MEKVSLKKMFFSTFTLSMFTFGGGFVIVPLMKKKFVDELNWIEEAEMMDLVAIAQSSPGAIAVNGSIIIGYRLRGLVGVLVNVIATVLPPLIILTVISSCYEAFRSSVLVSLLLRGMQVAVAAVIVDVIWSMVQGLVKKKEWKSIAIATIALICAAGFKINVVVILLVALFLGFFQAIFIEKARKERIG